MVPRVPSPPKKHPQPESSVTYILSLSLPRNNKISLQVLFLPYQFYVHIIIILYTLYIVFVWNNVDELSQYKNKLDCSIPIENLVPTKYFISQKVYSCFIILPLLLKIICSHNNQESKQRCSNISYNKFNAEPKHKIISYMSLIFFMTQSHSSMAHHQRIIGMSMSLKYGI